MLAGAQDGRGDVRGAPRPDDQEREEDGAGAVLDRAEPLVGVGAHEMHGAGKMTIAQALGDFFQIMAVTPGHIGE